ncbi:MAG TPA: hypothetical protein VGB84_06175 [Arachidicoccus sp.]
MKKFLYISFGAALFLSACGRKTVPQQTVTKPLHPKIAPDRIDQKQYVKKAVVLDSAASKLNAQKEIADSYNAVNNNGITAATNAASAVIIVIDSHGALLIDSTNLPRTVSHNLDSLNQATRAFTPNQAKNLAHRFNEIPPRILLVPDNVAKKGVKGYYYKYENKFWYWKKDDGYFYLDENYYQ